MGTRIVTYQSPNGATVSLTRRDVWALRNAGVWPCDHRGAEYCTVSHGERCGQQSAEDAAKVRETLGGVMTGKHTPGPWEAHGRAVYTADKRKHWVEGRDRRAVYVAQIRARHDAEIGERCDDITDNPVGEDEANANARLISAAPDMLKALRSAVALLTDPDAGEGEANETLAELEAAIRKATGEEGGAR